MKTSARIGALGAAFGLLLSGVAPSPASLPEVPLVSAAPQPAILAQSAPSLGDYGDAPDGGATGYPGLFTQIGSFPTLFASNGARVLDTSGATLGLTSSMEVDANDPLDPDGVTNLTNTDGDDGIVNFALVLNSIPPPAALSVAVTGGSGGQFYLNVLIDLNMDGAWGGLTPSGAPEWVVQNFPVAVAAGESTVVTPPAFAFGNGNRLPDPAWMRIALTSEPVPDTDWDGTGVFGSGEIEDHLITLPIVDSKPLPIVAVTCDQGGHYTFTPADVVILFNCTVTNLTGNPGSFTWSLFGPLTGGVMVGPIVGGPLPIGPGAAVVIPPAGAFMAVRGPLPSTWRIRVTAIDPPAIVTAEGVTVGFGDSEHDLDFSGPTVALPTPTSGISLRTPTPGPSATPTPVTAIAPTATPTPPSTAARTATATVVSTPTLSGTVVTGGGGFFELTVVHGQGTSEIVIFGEGFTPGQTVSIRATGPGVLRGEATATAAANGTFRTTVLINRFGRYDVTVGGVTRQIDVR